jgi:predicted nucleic acid-binding protein
MASRIVIDACVLYPTVMRAVVLGAAKEGFFEPVWSGRILEEWARAAIRLGPAGEAQARAEIALLRADWPEAERPEASHLEERLWLPDSNDVHVLATAVDAQADAIMTLNAKDFPRGILQEEGMERVDPDGFLTARLATSYDTIAEVADRVLAEARGLSGEDWELRPLLKKARLPRLAKALTR